MNGSESTISGRTFDPSHHGDDRFYDGLNRAATKTLHNLGTVAAYTYSYDNPATNGIGRLTSVVNQNGTDGYYYDTYDEFGRVTAARQITGGGSPYPTSYGYDLANNVTTEQYPSNKVVDTSYDNSGRVLTAGFAAGQPSANSFTYAASGGLESFTLGNNLVEHTSYNGKLHPFLIGLGSSVADSSSCGSTTLTEYSLARLSTPHRTMAIFRVKQSQSERAAAILKQWLKVSLMMQSTGSAPLLKPLADHRAGLRATDTTNMETAGCRPTLG